MSDFPEVPESDKAIKRLVRSVVEVDREMAELEAAVADLNQRADVQDQPIQRGLRLVYDRDSETDKKET